MNTKILVSVIVILIIVLGFVAYVASNNGNGNSYTATTSNTATSPFRAENNVIVVSEQPAEAPTVTASSIFLATPGFVVVHEDASGTPGAILGVSSVLEIGESINVQIPLSRPLRDGERLYAMLHVDMDSNFVFDVTVDAPIQSALGGPIMTVFEASSDASTSTSVTI